MLASPVPTQTEPSAGLTASAPIDRLGMKSKMACHVRPWSVERHTPPSAAPAYQEPSGACTSAVVRPPTREKPAPMLDQNGSV